MNNKQLERLANSTKDSISNTIDELVQEIENLQSTNIELENQITSLTEQIENLQNN